MERVARRADVILIPFPFTNLSASKLRPGVVLAELGRADVLICQVTSNPYADPNAIPLDALAFEKGGLRKTSFAQAGKLFTGNQSIIRGNVGSLRPEVCQRIVDRIIALLREK